MRNLSFIHTLKPEERGNLYANFLLDNNINKIESETLKKSLSTSMLFEYKNDLYHYYRQTDDNYLNDFMSKRINGNHKSLLWVESQVNYRKVN
jgi:hypothetical protein